MDKEEIVGLLVAGESSVGKCCMLYRFCKGIFAKKRVIGGDFMVHHGKIDEINVKLLIWSSDFFKFRKAPNYFFEKIKGVIIIFDLINRGSFNQIKKWKNLITKSISYPIDIVLVGNKCDLDHKITREEADEKAKELGIPYFETSAKTDVNVKEMFMKITRMILIRKGKINNPSTFGNHIHVKRDDGNKKCSFQFLKTLQNIIFKISENNVIDSVESIMNIHIIFNNKYPYSFKLVISQLIYSYCVSHSNNYEICFQFMNIIEQKYKIKMFEVFSRYLLGLDTKESDYLLAKMIEQELIETNSIKNKKSLNFAHMKTIKEILTSKLPFKEQITQNYEILSKNDLELHKKYVKEGVNPNEIARIIRNDDIEKLQEISSQNDFDFNQKIEPSLYERCSFINKEDVTLIDYAAFFSSVKCFKHLLLNKSGINNTGKYAIAGGHLEIIHICEQNHSSFEDAYEIAIEFHRNDIFHYFYANKANKIKYLSELGKICVLYHNYEILSFLEKEGMKTKYVINYSAKIGNLFLVKYYLEGNPIPKDLLVYSTISKNIELIKYILKQNEIDVNAKGNDGLTPLMWASQNNCIEIVCLLIKQKDINLNARDGNYFTPLMIATRSSNKEIVKILINTKGVDINAKDNGQEWTSLIYSSYCGNIEIVKLLLEQEGIDINAKDRDGNY